MFRLIGEGHGTRQIAEELHLSVKTVESYQAHIKEKLSLKNARELVQRAIQWSDQGTSDCERTQAFRTGRAKSASGVMLGLCFDRMKPQRSLVQVQCEYRRSYACDSSQDVGFLLVNAHLAPGSEFSTRHWDPLKSGQFRQ